MLLSYGRIDALETRSFIQGIDGRAASRFSVLAFITPLTETCDGVWLRKQIWSEALSAESPEKQTL